MNTENRILALRGKMDLDQALAEVGCRYIEIVETCEKHGFVFDVKNVRWTCRRYRRLLENHLEEELKFREHDKIIANSSNIR